MFLCQYCCFSSDKLIELDEEGFFLLLEIGFQASSIVKLFKTIRLKKQYCRVKICILKKVRYTYQAWRHDCTPDLRETQRAGASRMRCAYPFLRCVPGFWPVHPKKQCLRWGISFDTHSVLVFDNNPMHYLMKDIVVAQCSNEGYANKKS